MGANIFKIGDGTGSKQSEFFSLYKSLASDGQDRYAGAQSAQQNDKYRDLPISTHPIWAIAVAEKNLLLAAASGDASVHLWDLSHCEIIATLRAHKDTVWALEFSPNELELVTASADHTLRVWESHTGLPIGVIHAHGAPVRSVAFNYFGYLLSGAADSTIALWEKGNERPLQKWRAHDGPVHQVTFSPADPFTAMSIGADGSVAVWRAHDGELYGRFPGGDGGGVLCLAAHPQDSCVVATGLEDGTVWLWFVQPDRATSGAKVVGHHQLRGHTQAVWALQFSPRDGCLLATGSSDGNIRIWDLTNFSRPIAGAVFHAHDAWVRGICWLPFEDDDVQKDLWLISCSVDGKVNVWWTPKRLEKKNVMYWPQEPSITCTTEFAEKGSSYLQVATSEGFKVGDVISVTSVGREQSKEQCKVVALRYLIIDVDITFNNDYPAGSEVKVDQEHPSPQGAQAAQPLRFAAAGGDELQALKSVPEDDVATLIAPKGPQGLSEAQRAVTMQSHWSGSGAATPGIADAPSFAMVAEGDTTPLVALHSQPSFQVSIPPPPAAAGPKPVSPSQAAEEGRASSKPKPAPLAGTFGYEPSQLPAPPPTLGSACRS